MNAWWVIGMEREYWDDLVVNGRRILKWKLNKYGGSVSSEFSCLMITIEERTFDCSNKTICYTTERPSGLKSCLLRL